jgi:hypothetical protein
MSGIVPQVFQFILQSAVIEVWVFLEYGQPELGDILQAVVDLCPLKKLF